MKNKNILKKVSSLLVVCFISVVVLSACKKSEHPEHPATNAPATNAPAPAK